MKLALGTVQFGLPYGIANIAGQVSQEQAACILDRASNNGITNLDTAIAYGDSEEVLGRIGVSWARLITKLPLMPSGLKEVKSWVNAQVKTSLARLNINNLEAIMLHSTSDLNSENGKALFSALQDLKAVGTVRKVGYSIYSPDELDLYYQSFKPDIIQAPFNLMDRRLEQSGWLKKLKSEAVEVHTRSVFLQGLLLMKPEDRPQKFSKWQHNFVAFDRWIEEQKITPVQAALGFVNAINEIDKIVVGVDSVAQLDELLKLYDYTLQTAPEDIASDDENLLNPSYWNKLQ